ncbi:hypothetical protein JCM10207_007918 [Rhodosporidiobolus poonsookiae]
MSTVTQPIELDVISPAVPLPTLTRPSTVGSIGLEEGGVKADDGDTDRLRGLNTAQGEGEGTQELPPVDRGRGAWGFVVAAFFLETFIWGYSYSFASVLVWLQHNKPWSDNSVSTLSAIGSIQLGVQFLLPLPTILAFRRYPEYVKLVLWVCVVLNCGSMLISSFANKVWQLIILQGVIAGASGSVLYTPVLIWLNDWFVLRKGLASGIIFGGAGIGGFAFPFLLSALLNKTGFAWTLRIWSFLTLTVFSVSVYLIKPRVPPPKRINQGERGPWLAVDPKVLLNPILIAMCFASLFCSLATFPASLYLATYAASLTPSTFTAEIVVGVYNLAASLGCAITGWLSDRNWPLAATLCGAFSSICALSAWGLADSLSKVFGFAVVAGFTSQIIAAWGSCATDVASNGSPYTATLAFGVLSIVRGAASVAMPFVAEGLYRPDAKGADAKRFGRFGFEMMIIFIGIMGFLAALAGVAIALIRRKMVKEGKLRKQ